MIRYAATNDIELLLEHDKHISREELANSIKLNRVLVAYEGNKFIGWLRYNLFWDNTPFMNMLYIVDGERGKGYGGELTSFWENEMKNNGYDRVLTSSQSDEQGQFFYRKHGYIDCGVLLLPGEVSEILFYKEL